MIFLTKTPSGKPKIVDNNGFSIANAPDATKESVEYFKRLVLCYNILIDVDLERLKSMPKSLIK